MPPPAMLPMIEFRCESMDCRAGVEVPLRAEVEGWRDSEPWVAAARSSDAWLTPCEIGSVVVLPACGWVLIALFAAETEVEGVGILLVLREDELRCLREGVGCVAPVI